jgi:hypothetical protein
MLDEVGRVVLSRAEGGWIVQQADYGTRARRGGESGQRALTRLPGAVEGDDPGIGQRFGDEAAGFAGYQV